MRMLGNGLFLLVLLFGVGCCQADNKVYSFGVLNQRSISTTAEYWNPILKFVGDKAGVSLQLKMTKTNLENSAAVGRGEFDFAYTNHFFSPENAPAGYRVFARPTQEMIQGQLAVLEDSPIKVFGDLEDKEVAFASPAAFAGYQLQMDALLRAGATVKAVFAGTQDGALTQLKTGRVAAAGINSQFLGEFALRENMKFRVIWSSEKYHNLPLGAHPRVPADVLAAVRAAFVGMAKDPQGRKILEASADLVKQKPPYGFLVADDGDYENYRKYYKHTLVKSAQ